MTSVTSLDGRTFDLETSPGAAASPGEVLAVETEDRILAQVRHGSPPGGVLLGRPHNGQVHPPPVVPFNQAPLDPLAEGDLVALQSAIRAPIEVGTWTNGGVTVPALMDAMAFNRHTFLCGQSGSGKTYALGLLLERLMLETDLRIVVADPNADYVHLSTSTGAAGEADFGRLVRNGVTVLGSSSTGHAPLRLRFPRMPRAAKAALLRLDPLADRDEYDRFLSLTAEGSREEIGQIVQRLRDGGPAELRLAQRITNLGLENWEVWAGADQAVAEIVEGSRGTTVLDLSGFHDPVEPLAVYLSLLEDLWHQRNDREPTLLVIDEAHNLCPPAPTGAVQNALVERLVQIAAEGRKYGLWLLLSTQRPSKLHPQVLSQCDNLVLMRINSSEDVGELAHTFGFAPPAMVAAAQSFRQGEALVAGRMSPVPAVFRMGERWTREGGRDVSVPIAPR